MNTVLEQFAKLCNRKTSALDDCKHCVSVDWICSRNYDSSNPVGHDDVTALPDDLEANPLKSLDSLLV